MSNFGFVPEASALEILGLAQAINPIKQAPQLKEVYPAALSLAGFGLNYWCLISPESASNLSPSQLMLLCDKRKECTPAPT